MAASASGNLLSVANPGVSAQLSRAILWQLPGRGEHLRVRRANVWDGACQGLLVRPARLIREKLVAWRIRRHV
jgi:hypothetical protein